MARAPHASQKLRCRSGREHAGQSWVVVTATVAPVRAEEKDRFSSAGRAPGSRLAALNVCADAPAGPVLI
ncbi:hypothetical protein JCM9957A_15360 [Kineosporia succinea]